MIKDTEKRRKEIKQMTLTWLAGREEKVLKKIFRDTRNTRNESQSKRNRKVDNQALESSGGVLLLK